MVIIFHFLLYSVVWINQYKINIFYVIFATNVIYNIIYYVMPRVGKKLKIVDIADHNNEVVEEKPIENITDAQELNMIKEEIENNEKNMFSN